MKPTKKLPLFIITGASGIGKSALCEKLFRNETDYIVMESDLLWNDIYNTPEDNYSAYRKLWMKICAHISQAGKPVVLCGCAVPEQFELHLERDLFSRIYYLALVGDEQTLITRMRDGRKITDENWINSSVSYNNWLKENYSKTNPEITIVDTTGKTVEDCAATVNDWIINRISAEYR